MDMKEHILAAMREQYERWEALLASLSEEQITDPRFDYNWSIKDVVTHLWGWQQISIARVNAARLNREPDYPDLVAELGPGWEENPDRTNAWIYKTHHEKTWQEVHRLWREGYLQLIASGAPIAERDLLDAERFAWLNGYSLAFILIASYDHHQEHLDKLKTIQR
jgi:hypothetical protein